MTPSPERASPAAPAAPDRYRYQAVLLDLDLTIFDFRASEIAAFRDCLELVGAAERTDEIFPRYRSINGALWAQVEAGSLTPDQAGARRFETLLTEFGLSGAEPAALGEHFQTGLGRHGDLYPGAAAVLDTLAAQVPLALVTNGIGSVQRAKIDRLGLERWFEVIVISGEVGVAKPDPAMFDLVFDGLGHGLRSTSVMVGDSLTSDMAGGRAAGIDTCWFAPDASNADHPSVDHHITALEQLPGLAATVH